MRNLVSDGVLVSTQLEAQLSNLSVNGPIVLISLVINGKMIEKFF